MVNVQQLLMKVFLNLGRTTTEKIQQPNELIGENQFGSLKNQLWSHYPTCPKVGPVEALRQCVECATIIDESFPRFGASICHENYRLRPVIRL